ncbi:MAG: glycosyltransferase family 4 protein [Candidatus Andersenbacteria bacterium]|nr:glycosyltransferase family 4 protein [Candidatus Andersenbacteria bacterium]
MKVCFLGTYEKNYPSNRIIIKGLKKNGIDIVECHISLWEKYRNKHGNFLKLFSMFKLAVGLVAAYTRLCFMFFSKCKNVDVIVVGYIGQLDIFFLKALLLFKKNKPKILFVPLVSLYDTAIADRGLSGRNNLFAKLLFYIDKFSFKIADLVVFDTNEHINYISDLFNLNKSKFKRIWVGADEDVFYPMEIESFKKNCHPELVSGSSSDVGLADSKFSKQTVTNNSFQVLFIGKYIPLHGLEYIIKAAKLLENEDKSVKIKIIGSGQLDEEIMNLRKKLETKNIDFVDWIEYNKLVNEINKADVILGIFGGTDKSLRVIPNKVFQAIACKKAVITGDSPAIRELFTDKENILLCKNRNSKALKNAILELKNGDKLRKKIAENSYMNFQDNFSSKKIGKMIADIIIDLKK